MSGKDVVLKISMTLDGFVGGPNGELDWIFPSLSDDAATWMVDTLAGASVHIMGSRTFVDMAAWWPNSAEPFAAPMNEIPKAVFSRNDDIASLLNTRALADAQNSGRPRLEQSSQAARTWAEAEVISDDIADGVQRLKQQPGSYILAHGGASFVRSLIAADVVDEYRLLVHPVALGRGLPIFSGLERPLNLSLRESNAFKGGVIAQVYRAVR